MFSHAAGKKKLRHALMRLAKFSFRLWYGSDGVVPDGNEAASVCILNGIHRGAVIKVGNVPVSLGGKAGCDALLSDAGMMENRIDLSIDDRGRVAVTLRDGSAVVGSRAARLDHPVPLATGAVLKMGDVRIARGARLADVRRDVRQREKRRAALNWTVAIAASLILVGGLGSFSGGTAGAFIANGDAGRMAQVPVSAAQLGVTASTALRRELDQAGLAGAVSVDQLAMSEQILVTGVVTPEERKRWLSVARWFDGRFGGRVMLKTDLQDRDTALVVPFRITAVVVAPNPRVVIQDGRIFPLGAVLPGGWEIRDIADMNVVLVRENRELKIAF